MRNDRGDAPVNNSGSCVDSQFLPRRRARTGTEHTSRKRATASKTGRPTTPAWSLCRRAQTPEVQLPIIRHGKPIHLVVDSTGVKIYGEGEWKMRQHGYSKRRTWRKVHLALDANTSQVRAALMTHQDVADSDVLAELLDQIPTDERLDSVGGDGAYDSKPCHAAIAARGATPGIPPRDGAVHWKASVPGAAWRNEAVDTIAENAMYRFKTLTGPCPWARRADSQPTEVAIRVGELNRMTELARTLSVRVV